MAKQIELGVDARIKLAAGITKLTTAVAATLGPSGRNVVISKQYGVPHVTKDGVTVAKEIELKDPVENVGAQMVKEVASKTADIAGDGTTTATVLAQSMITSGMKFVAAGSNPTDIKRGIDKAVSSVVSKLKEISQEVGNDTSKVEQIATISANNDSSIGEIIAEAMKVVGNDGVITVEQAKGTLTELKTVEGMQFNRGYLSPYFVTNQEKMLAEMENPYILLVDKKIGSMKELLPVLEPVVGTGRGLVVIAEDLDGDALATLVVNRVRGALKVAAVKAPGFGEKRTEMLRDLAIVTGGQVVSDEFGITLDKVTLDMLGTAEKVEIGKETTTVINGHGDKEEIRERINHIRGQIETNTSDFEKEKLQERLAKLAGGIAVLYIGAPTETELKEKKDRVDDALAATKAAVEEGIVPGGGVALIRCIESLIDLNGSNADENIGVSIVKKALEEPLRQIMVNAGFDAPEIITNVKSGTGAYGYNARSEEYVDMIEAGVIDPTKVTRTAIENAASIAAMVLTTECVIVEEPTADDTDPQMGMV